jgi:hypothetical protein
MVCLGNICINTLHKGAKDDDDDDDDADYDNNNGSINVTYLTPPLFSPKLCCRTIHWL